MGHTLLPPLHHPGARLPALQTPKSRGRSPPVCRRCHAGKGRIHLGRMDPVTEVTALQPLLTWREQPRGQLRNRLQNTNSSLSARLIFDVLRLSSSMYSFSQFGSVYTKCFCPLIYCKLKGSYFF